MSYLIFNTSAAKKKSNRWLLFFCFYVRMNGADKEGATMMFPFLTLKDGTEIVHSEMKADEHT
ncbi:MAG: hypothetical protein LUC27_07515, partial [Lachnospiraceae bacterium]|nr:hypothetical protein [Lachnospiraceae bacterium]